MAKGYILSKRLGESEKKKVLSEMQKFHKKNEQIESRNKSIREHNSKQKYKKDYIKEEKMVPGTEVIKKLRSKGLGYSDKNMYHDINRKGATFNAKTSGARARATKWFDDYFEPFRQDKGLSRRKAYELWEKAKSQSYDNMTRMELEFALELREIGSP
jgi:hypothetical protein